MARSKEEKEIIKLLRSGNFTVVGTDNGEYDLIEGRFRNYEDCYDENGETEGDCYGLSDNDGMGYIGSVIDLMAEALGGKTTSI